MPLVGVHKTFTTPYHPASDGLVERFNRTLLMLLAMFAGEHRDDWDDCFSRWAEAYLLPSKTAVAVADACFQLIICRFGMPAVIHSDQGREFQNHLMQELCLLLGCI